MSTSRFQLVAGVARGGVPKPAWPTIDVPFSGELGYDDSWVSWRLTSANYRELGRAMQVFASVDNALASIESLRLALDTATHSIFASSHGDRWTWRLTIGDLAVATSGRAFARRRECAYNLEAFLVGVPAAEVPETSLRRRAAPVPVAAGTVSEFAE